MQMMSLAGFESQASWAGPSASISDVEFRGVARSVEDGFSNIEVAGDLTLPELWALYEDTGFLYPEKVARLAPYLEEIHQTIRTLLRANGDLNETVTTRRAGELTGHLCALRAYSHTWIIQHLAARRRLGGAGCLNLAIARYAQARHDVQWLKMFFRPDNAFPRTVFGSYAESLAGDSRSDLRSFNYLTADTATTLRTEGGVVVRPAVAADQGLITSWFSSRGRQAELLANDLSVDPSLAATARRFGRFGLGRRREVLVAERHGVPAGFALLEVSSLGMNLSELTNALTLHLLEPDASIGEALIDAARTYYAALGRRQVVALAESDTLPLFERAGFSRSKDYLCWTVRRDHIAGVLGHFEHLFRRSRSRNVSDGE